MQITILLDYRRVVIGIAIQACVRACIIHTNIDAFGTAACISLGRILSPYHWPAGYIPDPLGIDTVRRQNAAAGKIGLLRTGTHLQAISGGYLGNPGGNPFHFFCRWRSRIQNILISPGIFVFIQKADHTFIRCISQSCGKPVKLFHMIFRRIGGA